MKEKQTAIYLNHAELVKIQWALNNLHLGINMGEINPSVHKGLQQELDEITAILGKVKEAKDEVCAKEAAEQAKLALEKSIRDNDAIRANA